MEFRRVATAKISSGTWVHASDQGVRAFQPLEYDHVKVTYKPATDSMHCVLWETPNGPTFVVDPDDKLSEMALKAFRDSQRRDPGASP